MNKYLKKLWCCLFEADFQRGRNIVNASQGQIVWKSGVARKIDAVAHSLQHDLMQIDDLRKFTCDDVFQLVF